MGYLEDAEKALDQELARSRQKNAQKKIEEAAKLAAEQNKNNG